MLLSFDSKIFGFVCCCTSVQVQQHRYTQEVTLKEAF